MPKVVTIADRIVVRNHDDGGLPFEPPRLVATRVLPGRWWVGRGGLCHVDRDPATLAAPISPTEFGRIHDMPWFLVTHDAWAERSCECDDASGAADPRLAWADGDAAWAHDADGGGCHFTPAIQQCNRTFAVPFVDRGGRVAAVGFGDCEPGGAPGLTEPERGRVIRSARARIVAQHAAPLTPAATARAETGC